MTVKVDAKIELIKVKIQHEIERLEHQETESDKFSRTARINGLRYAIRIVDEVNATVK